MGVSLGGYGLYKLMFGDKWSWGLFGVALWGIVYGVFMGAGVFGFISPEELRDRARPRASSVAHTSADEQSAAMTTLDGIRYTMRWSTHRKYS